MAKKLILVDTPVLIELFRKTNKENTTLISLVRQGYSFYISSIIEYEIYVGTTPTQSEFWNEFLEKIGILPFDKKVSKVAVEINKQLKRKRKLIDLFIAAIAVANNLAFATLNKTHFENIDNLILID
jgi:predicted nucleic acid-binding protein